jgi:hypothetical protein
MSVVAPDEPTKRQLKKTPPPEYLDGLQINEYAHVADWLRRVAESGHVPRSYFAQSALASMHDIVTTMKAMTEHPD